MVYKQAVSQVSSLLPLINWSVGISQSKWWSYLSVYSPIFSQQNFLDKQLSHVDIDDLQSYSSHMTQMVSIPHPCLSFFSPGWRIDHFHSENQSLWSRSPFGKSWLHSKLLVAAISAAMYVGFLVVFARSSFGSLDGHQFSCSFCKVTVREHLRHWRSHIWIVPVR